MSQINNLNTNSIQTNTQIVANDISKNLVDTFGVTIPPAVAQTIANELLNMPSLQKPNGTFDQGKMKGLSSIMSGISLEILMEAVGAEDRRINTKAGVDSIAASGKERKEANTKQLEEMKKNLEEMKSKSVLNGFLKALKWIGMIIGAIAAVAITVVGAVTANPAFIAAGVIMMVMTLNSVVSAATDGEVSIGAGIGAIAKAFGASDEAAKWIGFGFEMSINVVAIGLSFGGAAAGGAANIAAQTADKVANLAGTIAKVSAFANAATAVTSGAAGITSAALDYQSALSKAELKHLEAILQKLAIAIELETEFLQSVMEKAEKLMQAVGELVHNNAETNIAILAGTPPTMA